MNSKKSLKQIQSIIEYKINENNTNEKYQFLKALLEGIQWKALFEKKNSKEGQDLCKVSFLSKKIKTLGSRDNFVDLFPLAFVANKNALYLAQNLKKFLQHLKLTLNFDMIISSSLANQKQNQQIRQKAIQLLQEQLKEFLESGKPLEFPQGFVLFLVKFFKENHQDFVDQQADIKQLFDAFYQNFKDSKMRSLFSIGEFKVLLEEQTQIDPHSPEYIKYLHRPVPLHKILQDLGPNITLSKEKLVPVLKKQQVLQEKDIFKSLMLMLKSNFNLIIKGGQHNKDFSVAQATFEFLNQDDFKIDDIFLH